ncbi:hypothetical protein B0I35DRAFT_480363 [Stachybotrys elegans]|uniref:Mitochondrial import inner membrane translocase subunit TIM22 n=1 Tax=Stachybotrys elegans TaxID=80388 RepID=A0A8K0SNY3_9HYPO|nr:hypothetical protein B0I35DRAFT_480363 [Stachybotrys elegans]
MAIETKKISTVDASESTVAPTAAPDVLPSSQPPPLFNAEPFPRLSITTPTRLILAPLASSFVGATLGAIQGGQIAQLRFRAEHAHKMPDTTAGWYFYHKTKNYHAMQGAIREGFRMGATTGFWTFVALGLETAVDRYRGSSDMFSTIVASLSVAGGFSLWHRLSLSTAARTARQGLLFGTVYGGLQDIMGLARGKPIGYIEFLRGNSRRGDALDEVAK